MRIIAFVAFMLIAGVCDNAYGDDESRDLSSVEKATFAEADDEMSRGHCGVAWNSVWDLFVGGSSNASGWLAAAIVLKGLVPPGSTTDGISQGRHAFILTAYSVASGNSDDLKLFRLIHSAIGVHNTRFLNCIDNQPENAQSCLNEAIENGVVPKLDSYAEEIALLAQGRLSEARCDPEAAVLPPELWP